MKGMAIMDEGVVKKFNVNLPDLYVDRKIPYSLEAEQSVLGSVILDPNLIGSVASKLTKDSFYVESHQEIFETLVDMYNLSMPADALVLLEKLRDKGLFGEDSEKEYLLSLAETASKITNVDYFVGIISEKAALRRVLKITSEITELCYENESITNVLDFAERELNDIVKGRQSVDLRNLRDLVREELNRLDEYQKDTTGKFEPIKIGISDFDNFMGGLNNSDLVILAARPGVGKTSFALSVAYNIATSTRYMPKKSVVFFSLEMSNGQLAQRIISNAGSIDSEDLRLGRINDEQWEWMFDFYRNSLMDTKLMFDDTSTITITEMKAKLRRVDNLGLVVIDYLQLMGGQNANRVQEISDLTRNFKLMAKELNVPIVLLSQLSRSITNREDKTPQLSDLRDSGSIEQDADIVIFLDRPEMYNKETTKRNICEVYIQKNRHGSTGKIDLQWDGKHTSFKSRERDIEVPEFE